MSVVSANDSDDFSSDFIEQFWAHIAPVVKAALGIHAVMLILFICLDVTILWATNIGSVILYLLSIRSMGKHRFQEATMFISVEVVLHASIATWKLGWESNFYLYGFCLIPIIAFNFHSYRRCAWALNGTLLSLIVGGVLVRDYFGSAPGTSAQAVKVLAACNAFIATALLLQATGLCVKFSWGAQVRLLQSANRDSLTNLYTRRRLLQRVKNTRSPSSKEPAALVLLDIDHFKLINDRFGHTHGDEVLRLVAEAVTLCVRQTDVACRWGGEEFLILMPNTTIAEAGKVAGRLRLQIAGVGIPGGGCDQNPITVTISVSIIRNDESFSDALHRLDAMLYSGKRQGRDQIVLCD